MAEPLVVTASNAAKPTAIVIFAHGLGDTGHGWLPVAKNWVYRNKFQHVKFIFPNAPTIPITVNMGMRMPGWYDITTFDDLGSKSHDEVGITRSRDYLVDLVKKESESTGIPSSRIVVGGFSQGGAISLFTGMTSTIKFGGVVGLSSYLLMGEKLEQLMPNDKPNKDTPFFMGHGEDDPLVKFSWGKQTAEKLKSFGYNVEFKSYEGLQHSADPEEIDDLEKFLNKVIPDGGS